jgi:3-oxoacyl-[acyl-carrier protein] reductase
MNLEKSLMKNRVALITGSSRGIGRDIALRLSEVCSGVAVHYRNDLQGAEKVVKKINEKGKTSAPFQADLSDEKDASALIQQVIEKFGGLDILINNVGPILVKEWEKTTTEEWEYIFRSNLMSALFCMKTALPNMRKKKWGRIINLGYSRVEQLTSFPTITPYAAAKTGLLILTRTAAATEASFGITINMVSPGLLEEGILPKDKRIPAGRLGKGEDVSDAVLFLTSEKSDYITGTNLIVAGGWKI